MTKTNQGRKSPPQHRIAVAALVAVLSATAAAIVARPADAPAAEGVTEPSVLPAARQLATPQPAVRRSAEIERLAVHISTTWGQPLAQSRRIVEAAFVHGPQRQLPPTLVLAVVAQESSFRPTARSGYGAQGLMQVVPRYHPEKIRGIGPKQLLKPEVNIDVGTRVLAEYVERGNGQLDAALVKYSGKATAYPQKIRLVWADLERVRRSVEASV